MKKMLALLLALTMCIALAACGGAKTDNENPKPEEETTPMGATEADSIRVCVVYSGNLGDKSYNDSCNVGAEKAVEDFGIQMKTLEGTTPDEWKANLAAACEGGYDLVICSSSNFTEYLQEFAPEYPDVKFAIIDTVVEGENIQSVSFAQNQGSFLAGAAAAMFTTYDEIEGVNDKNIIGWVGGMDIPVLRDFFIGYEQGAKYINPEIEVLQSFAGVWSDPLKGKELTIAQYDQGADIVMNVASGTGTGILEAAADEGKYAIGVDLNQDNDQPGHIFTSMVKRVDTACYTIIESVVNGTFEGNKSLYLDVALKGVSLTDFAVIKEALGDQFPEKIVEKTKEIAEKIANGEIVVENYEGFGPQE